MYDYLEGTVVRRPAAGATLAVGGVAYELLVPLGSVLPDEGARGRIWTHLGVRDDAHTLYGFGDRETRDLFRVLLKVKGVGPAMALAVLSGLPRAELVRAILEEDLVALTRVRGVGKKTGEQILLDLRDRAGTLAAGMDLGGGVLVPASRPGPERENIADASAALVALGFTDKDARKRVERAAETIDPADLEGLVQAAFRG